MKTPRQLRPDAFARAATFLRQSRLLDRALLSFHFERGPADRVRAALQEFQNPDGGYFGLEPDIGFPTSSVLCTCSALHHHRELGTPASDPAVSRALDFLLATFDASRGVWPIVPPHDNTHPHAPWWHHSEKSDENWHGYVDNPRPDVLACLLAFPAEKTDALVAEATKAVIARLQGAKEPIEMHGLICYVRLHDAARRSPALRAELDRALPPSISQAVERDPAKWGGYGLRPLLVAPESGSPWQPLIAEAIEANLDYLIDTQERDGSWAPNWSWGDFFPDAWPQAKLRWQAIITLTALRSLRSYGRIAAA